MCITIYMINEAGGIRPVHKRMTAKLEIISFFEYIFQN